MEMETSLARADALGRSYVSPASFASECIQASVEDLTLVSDLLGVSSRISRERGEAYLAFVTDELLERPLRFAFYRRGPLDAYLISVMSSDELSAAGNIFGLLNKLIEMGEQPDRFSCLLPFVPPLLATTPWIRDVYRFLRLVASVSPMSLYDDGLFQAIARRMTDGYYLETMELLRSGDLYGEVLQVWPIIHESLKLVRRKVHYLNETTLDEGVVDLCAAVQIVESACVYRTWHPHITPHIIFFGRDWPVLFQGIVYHLLAPPSVEFLVRCQRAQRLDSLIRSAFRLDDKRGDWDPVARRLVLQWPERVMAVAPHVTIPARTRTKHRCPITLEPCAHPVVASDGRTYERDAILRHMTSSMVSPMTNTELAFILCENYDAD